jgi:hypothetical protein
MNTKKIEFDQEQFFKLVQMVYLGRWMASSYQENPEKDDLEQYVYAQAKNFGLENWVDFDQESTQYLPSSELEEVMDPAIQDYDDHTFWDELAWQMAERDFARKYDHAKMLVMTEEEIFREKNIIADKYFDEFSVNGVENFNLSKP